MEQIPFAKRIVTAILMLYKKTKNKKKQKQWFFYLIVTPIFTTFTREFFKEIEKHHICL